jgi:hypothetical protein
LSWCVLWAHYVDFVPASRFLSGIPVASAVRARGRLSFGRRRSQTAEGKKGKNRMKKLGFAAFASLITGIAIAYPTKQEFAEARPLVAELMNPVLTEYKNKTKTAAEVAEASIQFSESAKARR